MRLMGADSGLTIATMRLADMMLPKPMLIKLISISSFLPIVNRELSHSMFWTCSRSFSISLFMSTTSCAASAELAFEAIVFVSRFIS